jgi:SmpA/OmlA family protein
MKPLALALCMVLAGCADAPVREGTLAGGATFKDYNRTPHGYLRVTKYPDGRTETKDLHTEENFKRIQPGMTPEEVEEIAGISTVGRARYANGTSSWTYRYRDVYVAKRMHVIFGADGRVQRYETEWDPRVYSIGGPGNR